MPRKTKKQLITIHMMSMDSVKVSCMEQTPSIIELGQLESEEKESDEN